MWNKIEKNEGKCVDLNLKDPLDFIKKNILSILEIKENFHVCLILKDKQELVDGIKKLTSQVKVIEQNNFNPEDITENFDYILVDLESLMEDGKETLSLLKEKLKDNGKLVTLAMNCFGVKYLCGGIYRENTNIFDTLVKKNLGISKNKLTSLLEEAGFSHHFFYYPFPDYEYTSVIFSEAFLPTTDMSKLTYSLQYFEGSKILFHEHEALRKMIDQKEFEHFANSFLVVSSLQEETGSQVRFASYNNLRKEKYRLVTKIYQDHVEKYCLSEAAKEHLERMKYNLETLKKLGFSLLDTYEQDHIVSQYVKQVPIYQEIIAQLKKGNIEEGVRFIQKWYEQIFRLLMVTQIEEKEHTIFEQFSVPIRKELKEKLHFVKDGFLDLVLENTFEIDHQYYFFDQEWNYKNTPIEFILYRAIHNLYSYFPKLEEIFSLDDCLKRFEILEWKVYFDALEKCVQEDIIDDTIYQAFGKFYSYYYSFQEKEENIKSQDEYIKKQADQIAYLDHEMEERLQKMNSLEKEISLLREELNRIYRSKSWKILSKLRGWK